MKTNLSKMLGLVLILSICLLAGCSKEKAVSVMLEKVAVESNKTCPIPVDEITRCDSIIHPKSTTTLAYYYSLTIPSSEINVAAMDWSLVKKALIDGIKTNPQITPLLKFNVTFNHVYFSKEGEKLYEAEILPADYAK